MRNYFKVKGLNWQYEIPPTPPPFGELFVFGKDDDELQANVNEVNALQRISFPTIIFHYPRAPIVIYWMLNATNFARVLNQAALQFWGNTNLPTNYPQDGLFVDMTQTEEEGSPRADFPTEEGTDGQRLEEGKASDAGTVLNYIALNFFPTREQEIIKVYRRLRDGQISARQALHRANFLLAKKNG